VREGPPFASEPSLIPLFVQSEAAIRLDSIPLFGHALGHCGAAIRQGTRWLLHVEDANYLRVEIGTDDHSVSLLAAQRAVDAKLRASVERLRRPARDHGDEIDLVATDERLREDDQFGPRSGVGGEVGEILEHPWGVEQDRGGLHHGDRHRPGTNGFSPGVLVGHDGLHQFIARIDNWMVVASDTHTRYGP
jgi:hypothetical protein